MWGPVKTIFRKEAKDHLRDSRSLILSLLFPLLAPALLGVLLYFVSTTNLDGPQEIAMNAPVAGQEYAPELMAYLRDNKITPTAAPLVKEFQEQAVMDGNLPFILIVPPEAEGKRIFNTELVIDRSSPKSMSAAANLMRVLGSYSREQGMAMIREAGLNPAMVTPLTVSQKNVGNTMNAAFLFYNMIPSLVMFMIFMGAVYLAIDVSVGERERGSLETLLVTPVSRTKVLLGKSLTALIFTMMIVFINLCAFYAALALATSGTSNMAPPPDSWIFLFLFVISIPLMMFAVTLQMIIAFMTRSAKEAQIYLGLLPIVPLVPGLAMVFGAVELTPAVAAIPIYGQLALFIDIIGGKGINWAAVGTSFLGTSIAAAVIFMIAAKMFQREKTILGTT